MTGFSNHEPGHTGAYVGVFRNIDRKNTGGPIVEDIDQQTWEIQKT
jgi:hypothetical protein